MKVLGIDSSGLVASVAVVEDELPHPASDTVVTVASKIDTSFFLII